MTDPHHTLEKVCKENSASPFSFSELYKEEIRRGILNLDTFKTCQDTDVPTRVIKENADIFAEFLHSSINESVKKSQISICFNISKHNTSF